MSIDENTMLSPFASVVAQSGDHLIFTRIDEARGRINKYFDLHMRIRQQLSSSSSVPTEGKDCLVKPSHMHVKDAGTLMVTHKKPFKVRFAKDNYHPSNQVTFF